MRPIARRLLSLSSGIHFRKLTLAWNHDSDALWIKGLVWACSGTLESLKIDRSTHGTLIRHLRPIVPSVDLLPFPAELESDPIDLSTAWKLEDVGFRFTNSSNVHWVSTALRTITTDHQNLREVLLFAPCMHYCILPTFDHTNPDAITRAIGEGVFRQWLEFDHLLARLWESHSIHLKFPCHRRQDGVHCPCGGSLLPEVTSRGMADLVEWGC